MQKKPAVDISSRKIIEYLKIIFIALLIAIEIIICADAYDRVKAFNFYIALACCFILLVLETINSFVFKNFIAKMVFYGLDSAVILTICIFTGNAFMSTIYCIVLTQCYLSVEKFKDKTILFGVSCVIFAVSSIAGYLINNPAMKAVEMTSGILFGLLAIVIDYLVTIFLLKFYRTNLELRAALKEADESRSQLEEAYDQLTQTRVFEERNRIAKDIHDTAGHSMTTVIMQTEAAKLLIDSNPAEAKNRIISANVQARNALEQMRESVHLLAGRGLGKPLKEELEEVIAQTLDGTEIKARYDIAAVQPTQEGYRFIVNSLKELLANGIRHGKATAFYIELKSDGKFITLLVSDNGAGVKGEFKEGFGLKGMREKAESLGGSLNVTSEAGEGFEAEIKVLKEEKKDD
ncbi:MAG: sensor histidine kinase [Clostridia bacterium]|nr:sensor histidine kinase [Clostridia bacterium]